MQNIKLNSEKFNELQKEFEQVNAVITHLEKMIADCNNSGFRMYLHNEWKTLVKRRTAIQDEQFHIVWG